MATVRAHIKPELLHWTRNRAKVPLEDAAKAAGVSAERLTSWEAGEEAPTLGQLRNLAKKYQFPLAVFYLPEPPNGFAPLRDFRRLPKADDNTIYPNLAYHIDAAYERRELALELFDGLGSSPQPFLLKVSIADDPEAVGLAIRKFFDIDDESQKQWARQSR